MLAEGTVDELQAQGPRSFAVRVEGAAPGWANALTDVDQVHTDAHGRVIIRVNDTADNNVDQALLQAALAAGTVREFGPVHVPLTELYREVVQS